jgi:hypothetical protein
MIQRQQSLWLILSTISAFLTYKLPFFSGVRSEKGMTQTAIIDGASNFFLLLLTGAIIILSLVTIFMFKDRSLQIRLSLLGIGLSILLLVLYFLEIKGLSGSISISAIFVFVILFGFIMAYINIRKDQKLIKSLDKLR